MKPIVAHTIRSMCAFVSDSGELHPIESVFSSLVNTIGGNDWNIEHEFDKLGDMTDVARATSLDAGSSGEDDVLAGLDSARRMRAEADALEARSLARLDQLREGSRYVADEAALELRISRRAAANRLGRAHALLQRMPELLALMEAGELEGYQAGRVTDVTAVLNDAQAREVDRHLGAKLTSGRVSLADPVGALRAARRLVEKVDPKGQAERARRARSDRRVELLPGEHAMSTLSADLPAELAAAAYSRVDGMARKLRERGEARTLDQLRADVYADLLLGRDPGVTAPETAALVFVHLPADTALTMNDEGCELAGYGPIPGAIAREIMTNADSAWRKVLTDPATGAPQSLGRQRRKPSAFIRDLVAVRDRECCAPGCHRPAQRSDFDHLHDWALDGATAVANGGMKCERDHYRKDASDWIYTHDPATGSTTVTTPGGRTYGKIRESVIEPRPATPDIPARRLVPT